MKKHVSVLKYGFLVLAVLSSGVGMAQKSAEKLIDSYFKVQSKSLGLSELSVKDWQLTKSTTDKKRNLSFHYINQIINGLPVLNATGVFVQKGEQVTLTGNRFIALGDDFPSKSASLSAEDCLNEVWKTIGNTSITAYDKSEKISNHQFVLKNAAYSREDIPVELAYFFDGTEVRLVYNMSIEMKDNLHWYSIYADANTGEVLYKNNWIVSCSFEGCSSEKHFNSNNLMKSDMNHSLMMAPAPPPQNDSYRVFPIPVESPIHGSDDLVVGPFNATASPFGWHDTNGAAGEEFTITRGNNVYASEDADNDNQPGYSPDGGANLVFDFPITSTINPTDYLDAAITNLFYMNNIMHDVWYNYGFDEAAGNFQQNNYGNGGNQNDYVKADAQDGSGTNNANFGTPPDGTSPRMQMYIWNGGTAPRLLYINSPSTIDGRYSSGRANFGPPVPNTPLTADLVLATDSVGNDPIDGCTQILNPAVAGKIAVVRKGGCTFDIKVKNCQDAGAIAVIVSNTTLGEPGSMNATPVDPITIPSVLMGINPGSTVLSKLQNGETINVTLFDDGWSGTTDSDLDNMIIAHEYGHGISNRLTGGPSASNCLGNAEQMGEGWSDWAGLMVTMEAGDLPGDRRGVGTFVQNEDTDGDGIRPAPYSTNFGINSFTYNSTNNQSVSQPHGIGFVWATMLWDLNWALIDQYGFDADVYNGTGGNNKLMELVITGMKLQPCNPGFVDGRDAILKADSLLNNAVNSCIIWRAFAKRGLGLLASQGSTFNRTDQVEDFSVPSNCILGLEETDATLNSLVIYPNPAQSDLTIQIQEGVSIESIRMLDVNGREVFAKTGIATNKFNLDISSFNAGVYFVEVGLTNGMTVRKIMKQ